MTFDKNHTIQFRKTAIQKFTSVPKKNPLNLLLSVLNFASVGGCFIEMNGSVGGSVKMKLKQCFLRKTMSPQPFSN